MQDLDYNRNVRMLIKGIGTHRGWGGHTGITLIDPETEEEINTYQFLRKFDLDLEY